MTGVDGEVSGVYYEYQKLDLTYKVANYPSKTQLSRSRIEDVIANAFDKWQGVLHFKFQRTTSDTPDIKLSFGSVPPGSGALAVANYQTRQAGSFKVAAHAIVFGDSFTWVDTSINWIPEYPDLFAVAVHEIGHVLGRPDNDIDQSFMYRTMKDQGKYRKPVPQMDIDPITSMYADLFSEYYAKQGQVRWWPLPALFDEYSMPSGPPAPLEPPKTATQLSFYQVSAGLDRTFWAIDAYGYAYDYGVGDKKWKYRGRWLSRVAVFGPNLVLGIFVDHPWNEWYGDLRRYNSRTEKWISVNKGSLGSSAKFKNVAVGGTEGSPEVWAVANPQPTSYKPVTDEDIEVVRYNGDIISGNGDWQVVASGIPGRGVANNPMHDLGVGRRSSGEPWICGALPKVDFRGDVPLPPRQIYEWRSFQPNPDPAPGLSPPAPPAPGPLGPTGLWQELGSDKGIPPDGRAVDAILEVSRWNNARRTFSVGNDGTIVAVFGDRAFRRLPKVGLWEELPRPGAQWIDISVVDKDAMWGVDANRNTFATIVPADRAKPITLSYDGPTKVTIGQPVQGQWTATGGKGPPYKFTTDPALPPGLSLSENGVLSGTVLDDSREGYEVTRSIKASDSISQWSTQQWTISVSPRVLHSRVISEPQIGTPVILGYEGPTKVIIGQPVQGRWTIAGATFPPYTFTTDFALPPGLSLSSDGVLSGTARGKPFSRDGYEVTGSITAIDSKGQRSSQQWTISVSPMPIVVTPTELPDAVAGQAYSVQLSASGGVAPYTFAEHELAYNLFLNSSGLISGTPGPSRDGSFNFPVDVMDAYLSAARFTFSGRVRPR